MALAIQVAAAFHGEVVDVAESDPRVGEEEARIGGSSESSINEETH